MTYDIRLREEAENDLTEASLWYQQQQSGLGHEFLDEVLSLLQSIQDRPLSYPIIYRETRRALTSRFPFCVFYQIQSGSIIIFAVMHASRAPHSWRDRT
ncbi:MAG: plasmid stabilization protein [SAR86 cluster bacterium]|uniref:Plasmid stabilization protein n=1 Tax=SAR86 cluster bacterium TaxID=2030880 RepID=A0A2A5ARU7_9GAMM|nr:MAG: plasmid stabilization protein [SAR86 cluster bacterium]